MHPRLGLEESVKTVEKKFPVQLLGFTNEARGRKFLYIPTNGLRKLKVRMIPAFIDTLLNYRVPRLLFPTSFLVFLSHYNASLREIKGCFGKLRTQKRPKTKWEMISVTPCICSFSLRSAG